MIDKKKFARTLRSNMTDAELKLWFRLRRRQLEGFRFRRQYLLGDYVVDFVCLSARLIIEIDGSQHQERKLEDAQRTDWLNLQGYRVLRFWNNEVLEELEGVLETIRTALLSPPS